jgi:hypothetical protein
LSMQIAIASLPRRALVLRPSRVVSYSALAIAAQVLRVTCVDVPRDDLYSKNHAVEFKGPYRMDEHVRAHHAQRLALRPLAHRRLVRAP